MMIGVVCLPVFFVWLWRMCVVVRARVSDTQRQAHKMCPPPKKTRKHCGLTAGERRDQVVVAVRRHVGDDDGAVGRRRREK